MCPVGERHDDDDGEVVRSIRAELSTLGLKRTVRSKLAVVESAVVAVLERAGIRADVDVSGTDVAREILTVAIQGPIEAELTAQIGAGPGERTPARLAQRNGHRPKLVSTPAGDIEVGVPNLATIGGSAGSIHSARSSPAGSPGHVESWPLRRGDIVAVAEPLLRRRDVRLPSRWRLVVPKHATTRGIDGKDGT